MHPAILVLYCLVFLVFLFCAVTVWKSAKTPAQSIIFGVTIPPSEQNASEVKAVTARFPKLCLKWGIIFLLTFLPAPVLLEIFPDRIAFSSACFMVWAIVISMYCINRPFRLVRCALLGVKRKNGWHFGALHETAVDTKTSLLKNRSVLPAWLFLPAAALPAILFFSEHGPFETGVVISACLSMFLTVLFYVCYRAAKNLRARVWSEDSKINLAINCERQRVWSQFWMITAYWNSISCVAAWTLLNLPERGTYGVAAVSILTGFAELALITVTDTAFRSFRKKLLSADKTPVVADDDDYWKDSWFAGLVYCNPNDTSTMVEKRVGTGTTMNIATKKGRLLCFGGMAVAAVLVVGLSAFLLLSDFSVPTMQIDSASRTVSVDTAFYGTKFDEASVKSVTLVDSIPNSSRTNGSDDGYTAVGHFTVDGYGPSLLYVHENNPPYLVIRLADKYIFYNEKTGGQTKAVYQKLIAAVGK